MSHFMGEIPYLDRLVPGEVSFDMPSEGGAILMPVHSDKRATLIVGINPGMISVAREDEEHLQVNALFEEWDANADGYFPVSALLLEEPAKRLTFMRLTEGWNIEEVTPAKENAKRLISFAKLVGLRALDEQRKGKRS